MINQSLDFSRHHETLRREGRVQIQHFLQHEVATALRDCLAQEVPWTLALQDGAGARTISFADYARLDAADRAALYLSAAQVPADTELPRGFRFAYDSYMMVSAYNEGRDPGLLLHRVLEFMNSPEYVGALRALTGDPRIRRVNAQATRYRPGQFLRQHTDAHSGEGRLYAYVINLTPAWQADWGGLLQFIGDDGGVADSWLPRWNSLSLFAVPAPHAVSLVAPWAHGDRLAITGWLLM
jgi:Rps23 Pro-64 3,4-dihydroxylase Tpa1-like proline 4-hydroxylase